MNHMLIKAIEEYFCSNIYKPFYCVCGDEEFRQVKEAINERGGVDFIRLSDCCNGEDKKPDMDRFRETLRMADIDCKTNRVIVLGVGEYLALEGEIYASAILNEFISFNLGSAHVAFLLRGVSKVVRDMTNADPRLENRQIIFNEDSTSLISLKLSTIELRMYEVTGFKKILMDLEDGVESNITGNTGLEFPNSIFPIQKTSNPYEAVKRMVPNLDVSKRVGSDQNWECLLKDLNRLGTMEKVFMDYRYEDITLEFYERIAGMAYKNWLFYLFLLCKQKMLHNSYLSYVLSVSDGLDDLKFQLLNAISKISTKDPLFTEYYAERKRLIKDFPVSDMAAFVNNNRENVSESIYKLTDTTLVEREEIIAEIAQHGLPKGLDGIYPDLACYLKKYSFTGDALDDLLTEYFEEYKQLKIRNELKEDFLEKVDQLAQKRLYNRLRNRDEIVGSINTKSSFLCWIDALGVEYLSFIVETAKQKGLAVTVNVGRANLPTITSINKAFYDNWPNEQKRKVNELDDIKHHEKGGYKYGPSNVYPIHLAKELMVLSDVINEAATDLGLRKYDKYVIASDHGASRLAVLRKKEEKYETDTQGIHSGRCCKFFESAELPFATEENGYLVLADYGRFKGSRASNVEVHGGASLEEVVVPVITLSLKDTSIVIKIVDEVVKADYKTGITVNVFINKCISQAVSIEYKGKRYVGVATDANHYRISIPEIKRPCTAEFDIYLDDSLISHGTVKVAGKSATMNSDFDDIF